MKSGPKPKNLKLNGRIPARVAKPKMPTWMSKEAKKLWRSLCPLLDVNAVLTELDGPALALLCEALAEYTKADQVLRQAEESNAPFCTKSARGTTTHPAARIKSKAWANAVALLREFGCTPAARASVEVAPADTADDMLDLIQKHYANRDGYHIDDDQVDEECEP